MSSNQSGASVSGTNNNINDVIKESLKIAFWKNYNSIKEGRFFLRYSVEEFKKNRSVAPEQYVAFKGLIKRMYLKKFNNLKIDVIKLMNNEILLVDKYSHLLDPEKKPRVVLVCGQFWSGSPERREKMIKFIVEKLIQNDIPITIYTEYSGLKKDLEKKYSDENILYKVNKMIKIITVKQRINIHYTMIECPGAPDESYVFIEYPHTEAYKFRLSVHFKYSDFLKIQRLKILRYLKSLRKKHSLQNFLSPHGWVINK